MTVSDALQLFHEYEARCAQYPGEIVMPPPNYNEATMELAAAYATDHPANDDALAEAKKLLLASGEFFDGYDLEGLPPYTINLNDAFYWACSDCETVPEECLLEVARLYQRYGRCGLYYWVLERRGEKRVEFKDVNRFVEFVRREEQLRKDVESSSKRAYHALTYTLGEEMAEPGWMQPKNPTGA